MTDSGTTRPGFDGERKLRELEAELERRWEAARATGFDTRFTKYIDEPVTRLELLLKGHLYVESLLIKSIEVAATRPGMLSLDRMGFADKVSVAAAVGGVAEDMVPALRRLNKVRNEVAHELDAPISESQVTEVVQLLPTRFRQIVLGPSDYCWRHDLLIM